MEKTKGEKLADSSPVFIAQSSAVLSNLSWKLDISKLDAEASWQENV